jgi:hypothetical protein
MVNFEHTSLNAFDLSEADTLNQHLLRQIPVEKWALLKCSFHPSFNFYQCHWNTVERWQSLNTLNIHQFSQL